LLWIFGSAEHLYSCKLFLISRAVVSKKNLKLDCYEFGALEINRVVDSTYNNYQSPQKQFFLLALETTQN